MSADRNDARLELLQRVNRHLIRQRSRRQASTPRPIPPAVLLSMRHVQWAVFVARQNPGLVPDGVIERAGFRTSRRKPTQQQRAAA